MIDAEAPTAAAKGCWTKEWVAPPAMHMPAKTSAQLVSVLGIRTNWAQSFRVDTNALLSRMDWSGRDRYPARFDEGTVGADRNVVGKSDRTRVRCWGSIFGPMG